MPLTDVSVRNAKPREKPYKLADERALYLEVTPSGGKLWRLKYRIGGTEKRLALGSYPDVSLAQARERRDEARKLLAKGVDPSAQRKAEKASAAGAGSFETIAREWHAKFSPSWSSLYALRTLERLETDVFPWIGKRPVDLITAPELLAVMRRIESRGAVETAHRALQKCGQVFRYAVATGRAERDPSGDLRAALAPAGGKKHYASLTDPKAVGQLLRDIEGYRGSFVTKCALRLAPLVFVRPGELCKAEWTEIDLQAAEWRIPGEKMKMGEKHLVPLSQQAVAILEDLHPLTGHARYVFPGSRSAKKKEATMSNGTILLALRRMGYAKGVMTGHGFRSMASTLLNEQGWHRDAIERQLAHAERNAIRAAYNYAQHLPERRKMMQAWADYLDGLKNGAEVIPFKKSI